MSKDEEMKELRDEIEELKSLINNLSKSQAEAYKDFDASAQEEEEKERKLNDKIQVTNKWQIKQVNPPPHLENVLFWWALKSTVKPFDSLKAYDRRRFRKTITKIHQEVSASRYHLRIFALFLQQSACVSDCFRRKVFKLGESHILYPYSLASRNLFNSYCCEFRVKGYSPFDPHLATLNPY